MNENSHLTIDSSKDESIKKAIALLHDDYKKTDISERKKRPIKEVLKGVAVLFSTVLLWIGLKYCFSKVSYFTNDILEILDISFLMIISVIMIFSFKHVAIWLIRIYQLIAPMRVRNACVFIPSCSEYAIMSIELYGVKVGLIKSLKRIKRCHYPNSGYDYP